MEEIIRVDISIGRGMNVDAPSHELTPRQGCRPPSRLAGRGDQVVFIEGVKRLATVIDVTAHRDELAPWAPVVTPVLIPNSR